MDDQSRVRILDEAPCQVRLDRLFFGADGQGSAVNNIYGFRCSEGHRVSRNSKLATYSRLKRFRASRGKSQIFFRYEKFAPWLSKWRVEITGDDQSGITPQEINAVLVQCRNHKLSLVELAFDFAPQCGVDEKFVLQHGLFGKSRRRTDRGGDGQLRYGGRLCPKLVRCYWKEELSRYRVELELHTAFLRKYSASRVNDFGVLCPKLLRSHFCFVGIRWRRLAAYLDKKFGRKRGTALRQAAQEQASISLRRGLRLLSRSGVTNPHRFLRALRINDEIELALRSWQGRFSSEGCG